MGENIYRIFDVVWKLSLVGGYCVLLVLLARLLLKKAPKWCSYLLWGSRICALVLSGVATDGDQSDSGAAAGGWNGDDVRTVSKRLW